MEYEMLDLAALQAELADKTAEVERLKDEIGKRAREELARLRMRCAELIPLAGFEDEPPAAAEPKRKELMTGRPKYRHPSSPQTTWTGTGRKPTWVREWIESGRSLEEIAIVE